MMVEALWRNIKRFSLRNHNRPRIDQVVHVIATDALTTYRMTLKRVLTDHRTQSRAPNLAHFNEAFKHAWERLLRVPIRGSYITDVNRFTCDCGAQKYHSYLLCKHLVQAIDSPPSTWWPEVIRYHVPPFYTPPINGISAEPPEPTAAHAWLPRMSAVNHLKTASPQDGTSTDAAIVIDDDSSDIDPVLHGSPGVDDRSSSPVCYVPLSCVPISHFDLFKIQSSPAKAPPTGRGDGLMRTRAGGGAGFEVRLQANRSNLSYSVLYFRFIS